MNNKAILEHFKNMDNLKMIVGSGNKNLGDMEDYTRFAQLYNLALTNDKDMISENSQFPVLNIDFNSVFMLGVSNYLENKFKNINPLKKTPSNKIKEGSITYNESNETTHFSIVDKFGNAVSITTTLNGSYGSKVVVDGAGFLLNNEIRSFKRNNKKKRK